MKIITKRREKRREKRKKNYLSHAGVWRTEEQTKRRKVFVTFSPLFHLAGFRVSISGSEKEKLKLK
jgi:hypothetical protein